MWSADARNKNRDGSDDEEGSSEESSEEEEESDDEAGPSTAAAITEAQNREERKNQKKARKEAAIAKAKAQAVQVGDLPPTDSEEESEDEMPANPNRSAAARNQTKPSVSSVTEGVKKLDVSAPASRREREAADAAAAKERYRKLHEAGKTDEAKADLARLKLIREKREAEAARKQVRINHPIYAHPSLVCRAVSQLRMYRSNKFFFPLHAGRKGRERSNRGRKESPDRSSRGQET